MSIYTEGAPVVLKVHFRGYDGAPVAPDSASAILQDEYGVIIADLGSVTLVPGATSAEILVPAVHNTIAAGSEGLGARSLIVRYSVGSFDTSFMVSYGLEREAALQVCVNSFQTWTRAQVEAAQIVNLSSFNDDTDENRRKFALVEAYNRLINLRLVYDVTLPSGQVRSYQLNADAWDSFTEDAFNTQLPSRLRRALIQAQLYEANEILHFDSNEIARKLRSGIQSETIGESSVTLNTKASSSTFGSSLIGISSSASAILAPFLDTTIRIGRA